MAVEVAAEEVAKRLGYKDGLRDLQRQVVVRCRDVLGSCLLAVEVSFCLCTISQYTREIELASHLTTYYPAG